MPENNKDTIKNLIKRFKYLDENDMLEGHKIKILVEDVLVFNDTISKENINIIKNYIDNGYKYYIR